MKSITFLIPFSLILYLCGCSADITNKATETALQQTNTLEQTLTLECKTEAIQSQINTIKSSIEQINETCELEKDKLGYKIKIRDLIIVILGVLLCWFVRK